ncbi:hypothetical protein J3R04_001069 [Spirilliplanes yamanashiensis]|nr:hypothetical protein [Spirilliplanes yamanashiensis]
MTVVAVLLGYGTTPAPEVVAEQGGTRRDDGPQGTA